ncbi:MAG: S41 family peptidase [Oscillospiraceae bacterium]
MLDGQIGYIKIANFDTRCAEETNAAMDELIAQDAKALIFDVRNNGGGYKNELVKVLDKILPEAFCSRARTIRARSKSTARTRTASTCPWPCSSIRIAIPRLEFFAAAIQEYDWGTVVGTKTVGKGNFQTAFTLSDGSMLNLSIGKYYTPQGRSLTDTGVIPDIEITLSDEDDAKLYYGQLEKADDAQLQAAIREITQKLSLTSLSLPDIMSAESL